MELIKSYIRFASTAPYAWAVYLALTLFMQTIGEHINRGDPSSALGDLFHMLMAIPFVYLIVQVVVNSRRLLKKKPKLNIKKVIYVILLVFMIGAINQIFKNVTLNLSGDTARSGVEEAQQEPINNRIESSDWKEYYATTGNFKILFPTYPEQDVQSIDATTNIPAYTITTYSSIPNNREEVYLASVAIYPNSVDTSIPETVLNNVVNGAVVGTEGELVSSNFSAFNNYTAVDYIVKAGKGFLKYKSFLIGQTEYTLAVGSAQNDFPEFNKFVNSFQLLGK